MATIGTGPKSQGYLWRARYLMQGVDDISDHGAKASYAAQFLAAWVVELTLKGYLSFRGWSTKRLREPEIRHDLVKLWEEAANEGLTIQPAAPDWCVLLSGLHASPYYSRYPVDGVNGHVEPSLARMRAGLGDLFRLTDRIVSHDS